MRLSKITQKRLNIFFPKEPVPPVIKNDFPFPYEQIVLPNYGLQQSIKSNIQKHSTTQSVLKNFHYALTMQNYLHRDPKITE